MSKQNPTPGESAAFDGNQVSSLVVKQGQAGTSDTAGTSLTMGVSGNPDTGAMYVQDLSGATGTTNIQGSVQVTGGTLNAVTLTDVGTNVNIFSGTQQTLGTVGIVNGLNTGTVTVVGNLNAGTITALASGTITGGTLQNLVSGTLQSSGTSTGVGVVSNLTNGSVNILTGTVTSVGTNVGMGTLSNVGSVNTVTNVTTVANLTNGTVRVSVGTINVGTVSVTTGTVGGAAANAAAASGNPNPVGGTDSGGTIRTILVDSTGVQRSTGSSVMTVGTLTVGTLTNLVSGTINALAAGTVTAGTLTNLVSGTINALAAGTITAGTLTNLVSGTINALAAGTITGGTLGNLNNGTLALVTTVSNLTNGSVNLLTGTVTRVSNVGTVESGTFRLDPTTIPTMLQQGTLGTAGGSFFGTLSAASGAGTKHYVQGVDIVVQSGTADVRVLAGSSIQGTGALAAGFFPPGGGIAKNWFPHFATGTNSELIYHFVGAGTAYINVSYWKGA